jgi:hypothetical protein
MLDKQNQGPQCTACGHPMKLSAIEPSSTGERSVKLHLPALQKGSAAHSLASHSLERMSPE